MNKRSFGASENTVGPSWDSLHEQIQCCCGRADCVVCHGHHHPQRRQRLLGRQRRKLGRGNRSRSFRWLRRRSRSLGRTPSPWRWFCFRGGSGRLFSAASSTNGGLCSDAGGLCTRAGGICPCSRGGIRSCASSLWSCSGLLRPCAGLLRPSVCLPRPLVRLGSAVCLRLSRYNFCWISRCGSGSVIMGF